MSDPLLISPDGLLAHSQVMEEAGKVGNDVSSAVRGAVADAGDFWGTDKFGQMFAKFFLPAVDGITTGSDALANNLVVSAETEADSAHLYVNTDQVNAETVGNHVGDLP